MQTNFNKLFDSENFRKQAYEVINVMAEYLENAQNNPDKLVMKWNEPDDLYEKWKTYPDNQKDIAKLFSDIIDDSNHLANPKYMGHQVSPSLPASALADLLSALLNNGMAIYEMGPASSAIEKVVLDIFTEKLGYDENSGGLMTSGGTLANLTALIAARNATAPYDIWEEGNNSDFAVLVSEEAHYSVSRSANIMGFGEQGVYKIPVNGNFQIDTNSLEGIYQTAISSGKSVVAVVGSACTTSTGSYDNLEEIAKFCKKHQLWFHVDGAHGGPVIFSEKYNHLMKGAEKADSVVIDLHKMMMSPTLGTALLFKKNENSYKAYSQKAQYLWQGDQDEWYNSAKKAFECTKLMISIKVFTIIQLYGLKFFGDFIDSRYDLAKEFAENLRQSKDFEIAHQPDANIVCFRYTDTTDNLSSFNSKLRRKMLEDGSFYIVQTELKGQVFLRISLMNPLTEISHLKAMIEKLREFALN